MRELPRESQTHSGADLPGANRYGSVSLMIAGIDAHDEADEVAFDELEEEDMSDGPCRAQRGATRGVTANIDNIELYEDVAEEPCLSKTGKPPTSTRWVGVIQHSVGEAFIRRRVLARGPWRKGVKREDLLSAAPPSDRLMSLLASPTIDVTRAHFEQVGEAGGRESLRPGLGGAVEAGQVLEVEERGSPG